MAMETTYAQVPIAISTLAAQRSVYLQRLERLKRLRLQHEGELNPRGIRLLDRSAFAAYCACRDIGAEQEALQILQSTSSDEATPPPDELFTSES